MKQSIHLNTKFNIDLVDKIKFYDPNTKQEETCECWTEDCGRCGHFNFDISDKEIRFFYGDCPILGFYENAKNSLRILFHQCPVPENFRQTDVFKFEFKYQIPTKMSDFVKSLNDFVENSNSTFTDLSIDFYDNFMKSNPDYETDPPLPF